MSTNEEQLVIARPPADVWAALADFGNISTWAPNVDHSCLVTPTINATTHGGGLDVVRRVQVGRNALLERIVEWEPSKRLAYELEGLPPVVRSVTNVWSLAATGADGGATVVTLSSRIEAGPRPPQRAAARIFGRVLAKASSEMLAGLKAHLENDPGSPA